MQETDKVDLKNWELLVYIVAELGGVSKPVHIERIASRAHAHNPTIYGWELEEYATQIDKEKVRRTLTSLETETNSRKRLLKSHRIFANKSFRKKDMWQLTPDGVQWLKMYQQEIESSLDDSSRLELKDSVSRRLIAHIKHTTFYSDYKSNGCITPSQNRFADMLDCSPDAKVEILKNRHENMLAQIYALDDEDLTEFISACTEAHKYLLTN